jgi:hypothetical protein
LVLQRRLPDVSLPRSFLPSNLPPQVDMICILQAWSWVLQLVHSKRYIHPYILAVFVSWKERHNGLTGQVGPTVSQTSFTGVPTPQLNCLQTTIRCV